MRQATIPLRWLALLWALVGAACQPSCGDNIYLRDAAPAHQSKGDGVGPVIDAAAVDAARDAMVGPDGGLDVADAMPLDAAIVDAAMADAGIVDGPLVDGPVIDAAMPDAPWVMIDAPRPDAPMVDARPVDARPVDARPVDARPVDAPVVDARPDAPLVDAPLVDARPVDAPVVDAPRPDAPLVDAPLVDAPVVDAPLVDAPPDAMPALARVVISEVVFSPQHDYSTATPPFLGVGTGNLTTDDEYVELENRGDGPVDLRNWLLRVRDSEVKDTLLGAQGVLAFSPGSSISALLPGGFVVIGNPTGASSTDAYLTLRDQYGRLVDDVEIGGNTPSRDTEGDGIGDGAPEPNANAFARGAFDEAVARPVTAPDTDHDINDFVSMYATPGRANLQPVPPPEAVPPTLIAWSQGAGLPVSGALELAFDEPVRAASVDAAGNIEVRVNGQLWPMGLARFGNDDRRVLLIPIGVYPFGASVEVSAHGIQDLNGNTMVGTHVSTVTMEVAPTNPASIQINELCISPLQDWNDSSGGNGIPFDGVPGDGEVNTTDEWVELLITQAGPVNLLNYQLIIFSGPTILQEARNVTRLTGTNSTVFGNGTLSALQIGDRVVIGNPIGAMPTSMVVELRTSTGVLVDQVEIGGNFASSDRGGDGPSNGAPGPGQDGASSTFANEVVGRSPDGMDTGSDLVDWAHQRATPGMAN